VLNGAEMHKDGNFEVRDVAPGSYTILATVDGAAVPMMARQELQGQLQMSRVFASRRKPGARFTGTLGWKAESMPDPRQARHFFCYVPQMAMTTGLLLTQ